MDGFRVKSENIATSTSIEGRAGSNYYSYFSLVIEPNNQVQVQLKCLKVIPFV